MKYLSAIKLAVLFPIFLAAMLLAPGRASAHCDGLDGPVVKAAQRALDTGNVNLVLIWVHKQDEAEIKRAFEKTAAVRKFSPQAKELADMYFFETLVRIHRAGEGAPYTGLKPAGRDLGAAIPAADKAIESGSLKPLLKILTDALNDSVREGFKEVSTKKKFKQDDLEGGREYVRAYTAFVEHVERIYETTKAEPASHAHE